MFTNLVLAVAMLGAGTTPAPDSPQLKVLEPATRRALAMPAFSYWSEGQCDGEANLYFHINGGDFRAAKFLKISANGEDSDILGPSGEFSDMEKFGFEGFFITRAGEPYVLGGDGKKTYVIAFAADGSMKTPVAIEAPEAVIVSGFAVFETGGFLVAGRYSSEAGPVSQRGKSYLAVFEPSGTLRKELRGLLADKSATDDSNTSLDDDTKITSSEDGKLYILNPDEIEVLSASGEVEGKIHFKKPDPHSMATKAYVSGNLVAIRLSTYNSDKAETQRRYLVLDRNNKDKPFGYYKPSEELDGPDVCFTRDHGFTFQSFDHGRQTLFVAPLR
jgi:hypothetical protein